MVIGPESLKRHESLEPCRDDVPTWDSGLHELGICGLSAALEKGPGSGLLLGFRGLGLRVSGF